MAQKKYKRRKSKSGGGNHDLLGITLIVISAFLLLCIAIKPILGVFSEAIFAVMLGVFGVASYPMLLFTLLLGIMVLRGQNKFPEGKKIVGVTLGVFFALIILQLATTHAFLNRDFSAYIDSTYTAKYSAGGIVMGLIAFGLQSVITEPACYVVFSVALIVDVLLLTSAVTRLRALRSDRKAKKLANEQQAPQAEKSAPARTEPQRVINAAPSLGLFTGTIERTSPEVVVETGNTSDLQERQERALSDYYETPVIEGDERRDDKPEKRNPVAAATHIKLYSDSEAIKMQAVEEWRQANSEQNKQAETIEHRASAPTPAPEPAEREGSFAMDADAPRRFDFDGTPSNLNELYLDLPIKRSNIHFNDEGIEDIDEIKAKLQEHNEERTRNDFAGSGRPRAGFVVPPPPPPIYGYSSSDKPLEQVEIIDNRTSSATQPAPQVDVPEMTAPPASAEDKFFAALGDDKITNDDDIITSDDDITTSDVPLLETNKFKPEDDIIDAFEELNKFGSKPAASAPPPPQEDILDGAGGFDPEALEPKIAYIDTEETTESTSIGDGSLIISGEPAKDLTERGFDSGDVLTGEDMSGVYIKADDENPSEPVQPQKPKRTKANAPMDNQISIEGMMQEQAKNTVVQDTKQYKRYNYAPPPVDLLKIHEKVELSQDELKENAAKLEQVLSGYLKTTVTVMNVAAGPQVTRYEVDIPSGTSVKGIPSLAKDIAYELAAKGSVRIEAPIPGKRAVGIEIPNAKPAIVGLREVVDSKEFQKDKSPMLFSVGKDVGGAIITCDLEKVPHLLIAGQTGSGKSAGLNSLIVSLLYKASPDDLRFILIDPKRVEFAKFRGMPHSLFENTLIEPQEALNALKWAENEMNRRYTVLSKYACSKLSEYNNLPEVKSGKATKLPHIVIIVDELANLMMSNVGGEIETKVSSIAALARAAGIHLILATQRPSADVITGTIKANLTSRIAFRVPDATNSRIILDELGAEALAGNGDMLYYPNDANATMRVQGSFVSGEEVASVVSYVKDHYDCDFDEDADSFVHSVAAPAGGNEGEEGKEKGGGNDMDALAASVMAHAIKNKQISTSVIQRRFSIGYARAARIVDTMEEAGYIGGSTGNNKGREVFMTVEQYRELFGHDLDEN